MLKNKTAIITGGTRGIGFGIVKKFLETEPEMIERRVRRLQKIEELEK